MTDETRRRYLKTLFRFSVTALFFFALGFTYEYHLPQIESFLLSKIEELADKHSPLQVLPEKLKLSLFPLGVSLTNVRVIPKDSLSSTLAPTTLKEVAVGINLWALIRGEVRLSRLIFRNSSITVFLRSEMFEKKTAGGKPAFSLEALKDIPVDEIGLENMVLMGRVDPQHLVFRVSELDLDVINLYNSLYIYFASPAWQFKPAGPYPTLNLEAQGRGLIDSGELRISALKVKSNESFLVASGLVNGDITGSTIETGRLSMRTHLDLADIADWVRVLPHPPPLPAMSGLVNVTADVNYHGHGQKPDMAVDLDTKDVKIDKFVVGDVTGKATVTPESFKSDLIEAKNSAGDARLEKISMTFKPELQAQATVDVHLIELRQLLNNLGVKDVPLHLDVGGSLPCKMTYAGHLDVRCEGEIHGTDFEVHSDKSQKTIVKAKDFRAKGTVVIDEQAVRYQAEGSFGSKSSGRSSGVIDYDKGFKIQYEGDNVAFADIENLVNLKFEGSVKVKGTTEGTADWATVQMNVQSKELWLEDFGVGDLATQVQYKAGHLVLRDVEGQYNNTRYSGHIDIDLRRDQIEITANMPYGELKDIQSLLIRRLPIPVELSGTGSGRVKAWGPLDIEKMNYQATSEFYRGTIAHENFDTLHMEVEAVDGTIHSKRLQLTKANGQLEMRGVLKPAWNVDAVLVGRGLRLEQSELVRDAGFDLQGQADFNFVIRGPLHQLQMELNGRLSKVIIADQPQDDSSFRLDISNTHMTGNAQFLGSKLQTQFVYPLAPKAPFALELKTNDWDVTNLFSVVSRYSSQMDFQTGITMEAKLHSDEGGFWNSSGLVEFKEMKIRHGADTMKSDGPMKIEFNKGAMTTEGFAISSGDNFLKLHMANSSRDHLNADLNGKLEMSMLGLVLPFISDLRGNLALSVDLKGSVDKPLMSGSVFVDKAYAKFRDFPHPFSNLRMDLLFNQQSLLINAFQAELGGGKVTADGRMSFIAHDNVPVDVKGTFTDVSVNIPEGYKTRGSGTVAIKGEKFPYNMAIHYDISGGDITADFTAQGGTSSVKASPYLPKSAQQESFEAFRFDLDLNLKKPINISNTLIRGQGQGQAQVRGVPGNLLMTGNFSPLPGAKLFFNDQPFDIGTAYVEYANYSPDNPRIYLTATTHKTEVVADQGQVQPTPVGVPGGGSVSVVRQTEQSYDITMLVQGRAQPAPQITLSSQPPLSQREIVSLLALGMTPTALDDQRQQSAGGTAAVGQLLQPAVGKLKDTLGVDMRVSTAPPTAADPTAAPMVTFSKQWTPKFSGSASSTFGQTQTNSVKLEYKMNRNLSVIGSWEDRDQSTTIFEGGSKDTSDSIFGLDLEYHFQFK